MRFDGFAETDILKKCPFFSNDVKFIIVRITV